MSRRFICCKAASRLATARVEEKCCECRRRFHFHPAGRAAPTLNLSDTEPAIAIVARNDPNEQEHVVLYPKEQQN
jgi:uncharacterized RmlC-like cupin family protein